jgi:hypothetical protein
MNSIKLWIQGILAIAFFPFILIILTLWALVFRIPMFAGQLWQEYREEKNDTR